MRGLLYGPTWSPPSSLSSPFFSAANLPNPILHPSGPFSLLNLRFFGPLILGAPYHGHHKYLISGIWAAPCPPQIISNPRPILLVDPIALSPMISMVDIA
eukprot:TRINITY_DN70496_c0_g1_i1.p1 TRINITY_DN70496_c0_g1~~TRINITY_DN70496_c0_g1_i1.p1  ORF type:complete len:100 (+),score=3.29 TRINITY_DN70496_c0_g1_i1:281-580(+)